MSTRFHCGICIYSWWRLTAHCQRLFTFATKVIRLFARFRRPLSLTTTSHNAELEKKKSFYILINFHENGFAVIPKLHTLKDTDNLFSLINLLVSGMCDWRFLW